VSQVTADQYLQYIALFLTLVEVIVGLYILVLNRHHSANRHVGIFLLLSAINTYAVGMMITAQSAAQAEYSAIILAMTTSATEPLLLVTSISLLRPQWLLGRYRWIWYPVYGLALLPAILTGIDLLFGTRTWYTGIDAETYSGGFLITPEFTGGNLSVLVRIGFILCFLVIFSILVYIARFDKQSTPKERKLAWILLIQQFATGAILTYFAQVIQPSITILITNTIFVVTYAFAAFEQMISERSKQSGSLQNRLIVVILIVAIPAMVASTAFIVNHAQRILKESNHRNLSTLTDQLQSSTYLWVTSNQNLLKQLAAQREVTSMDVARQQALLDEISSSHPDLSLISTIDLEGNLLASSGSESVGTQVDLEWLPDTNSRQVVHYQTVLGAPFNQPSLVSSVQIVSPDSQPAGYLMAVSPLKTVSELIGTGSFGENGFTYVLNTQDQIVAYSNPAQIRDLQILGEYPPVALLRQGILGPVSFSDSQGHRWQAKSGLLGNGWAVVAQIPVAELEAPANFLIRMAWFTLATAILILSMLSVLMIRQSIRPVRTLTQVTSAVAAGDLTQIAPIESEDEIGLLARSFNSMTNQVRDLVGGLEERVTKRTQDLEKRAVQLQVTAEVAQEAASIHDLNQLLTHTVNLISNRFDFYHAGIFLIDGSREYAVLVAASSEGGHRMLSRGHKLKIGQVGIVGYVAARGEPRIALDVGRDAVYFDNPDLPLTKSELALPMKAHSQVIGILDVQSVKAAAFTEEDSAILQILADQIALAIENARLLQSSEDALKELETLYRQQVEQAWEQRLENTVIAYTYDHMGVHPMPGRTDIEVSTQAQEPVYDDRTLRLPIRLREITLGGLELKREADDPPWSAEDIEVVETTMKQVALTLESSRLKEIERKRIKKEQLISQISAQTQSALDLDTVMKRAVLEIGQALKAEKVQIELKDYGLAVSPSGNGAHE
jgi:GAF domain-containing protein/HAMP domain-containing protein